jgi:hypothetical protein
LKTDENPYESPQHVGTSDRFLESSLPDGEEIVVQIGARSYSRPGRILRLFLPMIGKFVVTNRRLFFLSSGKFDEFPFFTEKSTVERIAGALDISALQRDSSWEFKIPDVRLAKAIKGSVWTTGPHLRVVGVDGNGKEVRRRVYRYRIKWDTWNEIATKINEIRENAAGTRYDEGPR